MIFLFRGQAAGQAVTSKPAEPRPTPAVVGQNTVDRPDYDDLLKVLAVVNPGK